MYNAYIEQNQIYFHFFYTFDRYIAKDCREKIQNRPQQIHKSDQRKCSHKQ